MMTNEGPVRFGWVMPRQLAGSGRPGRYHPIEDDLSFLETEGVTVIVSLLESTINLKEYREAGFEPNHFPVEDFTAPTLDQISEICKIIDESIEQGRGVLVHCNAGIGRTGTILSCFLVHKGAHPDDAIERIRNERPLSLETKEQIDIVHRYFERRRSD
jgi:atypical dual specificity phosphatase